MRIGFLSYDFHPARGGQGVEAYNLYARLREGHGLDIGVVSGSVNELEGHIGLPVREGPGGALRFSVKANRRLPALLGGMGPDALQIYGGPGGVILLRDPAVPVIYVANHTYHQQRAYLGRSIYRALARAEGAGYRRATHIVSISRTTRESLVRDYGIAEDKVSVIPVGVDTGLFRPLGLERMENSMLFVGRLCERKGLPSLLEACRRVSAEVPGFKVFIAGEGELREALRGGVEEMGLGGVVSLLGRVPDEELPLWYNRVALFCLPSLFEGFGIVCLEAMACGTPVVASRAPGIVDVIPPEHHGLLHAPGDARGLADNIIALLRDRERRLGIGRSLRATAEKGYGWEAVAARFVQVYERVLHV